MSFFRKINFFRKIDFFREIKRKISQHFETLYWYHIRRPIRLWYDEDEKKWYDLKDKRSTYYRAEGMLASTWEGEYDLWQIFLLKLDHMFWNLHKYGNEARYYFYSTDLEKYGNENDKKIFAKKIINSVFNRSETKSIWLFSGTVSNELSDNGRVSFSLEADDDLKKLYLVAKTNKLIPQEEIPKKKKMYTLESYIDENGKRQFEHKLADQYKTKDKIVLQEWFINPEEDFSEFILNRIDAIFEKRIKEFLKTEFDVEWNDKKSVMDCVLERVDQYCPQFEIAEIPSLSKKLKEHATGNRVKCQQILHLRRLIKKMLNIEDTDYNYLWVDENDEEVRSKKFKEAVKRFENDRKIAYQNIMEYLLKYSRNWWD